MNKLVQLFFRTYKITLFLMNVCIFLMIDCTNKTIIISFGHTCATATMIKYFNIRHKSYPFDWLISDLNGLIYAINNDFADFINKDYFKDVRDCNTYIDSMPGRMSHTLYNFFSLHDFSVYRNDPAIEQQFIVAKERFNRRIKRFIDIIQSGTKVMLIRWNNCLQAGIGVTKETYVQLRDILDNKFPGNKVSIIAVDQRDEYRQKWHLDRIYNYHMPYHRTSSDAHHLWVPILREHTIIS